MTARVPAPSGGGWVAVPLTLGIVGAAIPLLGSGFAVLGMASAWLAAIAVLVLAPTLLRVDPRMRVFIDVVGLVLTVVVVAPEGGWWFVPAVAAQLVLDVRAARPPLIGPGSGA
jgi:hypothetical protein